MAETASRARSASFSSANAPSAGATKDLEKYVKYLFYKASQIVVQSRQGGKLSTCSQGSPTSQSWFCLAIDDNSEITHEAKRAAGGKANVLKTSLCIEVSLKTIEGDSMVLETWVLSWRRDNADPNVRVNNTVRGNTVYNHMSLLLKSLLCVTRSTPAYRLSRRQGPETFVVCYRIYSVGEDDSLARVGASAAALGDRYQTANVGQVVTAVGTLNMRVDYRTQMTITPKSCSSSANDNCYAEDSFAGGAAGLAGSSATAGSSCPINLKSDHFYTGGRGGGFNSESEQQTSDESQDAMKLFAASPPDPTSPFFRRQMMAGRGGMPTTSSNESLTSNKLYRPRSNTNQSLGSASNQPGISAPDESQEGAGEEAQPVKVGAFVSRPLSAADRLSMAEDEEDDPLFHLCSVDEEKPAAAEPSAVAAAQTAEVQSKLERMELTQQAEQSGDKRPSLEDDKFVVLDLKTPFSGRGLAPGAGVNAGANSAELGIFFKGDGSGQQPPEANLNLASQLDNLNQKLEDFEKDLEEFDEMWKTMEVAPTDSESEVN